MYTAPFSGTIVLKWCLSHMRVKPLHVVFFIAIFHMEAPANRTSIRCPEYAMFIYVIANERRRQ
jgi:hypothetical protein